MVRLLVFLSVLLVLSAPALAESGAKQDRAVWESSGFLSAHPDVKHRKLGLHWMEQGREERAVEEFTRAARYADKPAQAMLAEMHWNGEGVPVDRARAYAWMDLAAERGYRLFLGKRELYWAALDPAEQARALEVGRTLYAKYGDSVARPRLARVIENERRRATGSRLGYIGRLKQILVFDRITTIVDGSEYYASHYWKPDEYFAWTDAIWAPMPLPNVEVGNPRQKDGAAGRGEI